MGDTVWLSRPAATVVLNMRITDGKLLYYHGISEENMDRNFFTLKDNNRIIYDCFNYTFTYEFSIPDLNLPPITFDDRPCLH